MAGLSDILGNEIAEGAVRAPSASLRSTPEAPEGGSGSAACSAHFGFSQKLEAAREENPGVRIDGYILFGSHADALGLFDAAKGEGFQVRISPTPRAARASCGVALLVPVDQVAPVCDLAGERGIAVENTAALPKQINAKRDRYC